MEFYVPLVRAKIGETKVKHEKVKKTCTFEFKVDEEDIPELFNILLGDSRLTTRIDFDCDLLFDFEENKPLKTPFEKLFKDLEDWDVGAVVAITPKARKKKKIKPKPEKKEAEKKEPKKEKPKEKKGEKK